MSERRRGAQRALPAARAAAYVFSILAAASPAAAETIAHLTLDGPTLIVMLPPTEGGADAEGLGEARAHAAFALADTRRCLGDTFVRFRTVVADSLVVEGGGASQTIRPAPGQPGDGLVVVLAQPGRAARAVHAATGASSLSHLVPQAVYEYWHARACKRE